MSSSNQILHSVFLLCLRVVGAGGGSVHDFHVRAICSAFAQRSGSEHQGADNDDIRHRESRSEILARTAQELEELRSENVELRRRWLPPVGQVRKGCTHILRHELDESVGVLYLFWHAFHLYIHSWI